MHISTAFTTLNTVVLAPTPRAIVATAIAVNPFVFQSDRMAWRMRLHEVAFASDAAGGEAAQIERCQVEAWIACRNHVGEDAASGGRMLESVPDEAVDQLQSVHNG